MERAKNSAYKIKSEIGTIYKENPKAVSMIRKILMMSVTIIICMLFVLLLQNKSPVILTGILTAILVYLLFSTNDTISPIIPPVIGFIIYTILNILEITNMKAQDMDMQNNMDAKYVEIKTTANNERSVCVSDYILQKLSSSIWKVPFWGIVAYYTIYSAQINVA